MNRRGVVCFAVFAWTELSLTVFGQVPMPERPPGVEGSTPASTQEEPDGSQRKMPAWLKLGFELRGRTESNNAFDHESSDMLYLNRLRFSVDLQPSSWLRSYIQVQDARVFGPDSTAHAYLRDTLDLRQAYVNVGRHEKGWQLRGGRQELAVGDERLVGSDNYWDSFGQTFDALRVSFTGDRFRADAFVGFLVHPISGQPAPFDTESRIAGLTVPMKIGGEGVLEPYFLWKRAASTFDLLERPGHRDVLTPGVRAAGHLPRRVDYNIEMAIQRGHVVKDRISAWAGHWELGWKPLGKEFGLRLGLEYNFASGDKDPGNGRNGTFDDLFPAGFNKYGMTDPIAWRNIRSPGIALEMPIAKRWSAFAGYRSYRLANLHDGLYPGGDRYLIRNPTATGADVGSHALVSAGYTRPEHWRAFAGYGYLFPGKFLRESGYKTPIRTAYLLFSCEF